MPGVEVEGVMAPVVVLIVRPVVELNAPAVAPVASMGTVVVVWLVQRLTEPAP